MILVTGSNGQLGYDVVRELKRRNLEVIGTTRDDFDITNKKEVENYILKYKPECIIHCAAYTAVDNAENQRDICFGVNVIGTENIALVCKKLGSKMIYISTDYVFDGKGNKPYEINDAINPVNFYGKTKYLGEEKVKESLDKYFIVRISWVFGINGKNFVKTMMELGKKRKSIDVVCDQIGSPTYTVDLAQLLCDMALSEKYGTYHATNEGICSWAEFAEEIMKQSNIDCIINEILSSDYKSQAKRPLNSRMSKKSLIDNQFNKMPNWKHAINRFLNEI